MFYYNQRKTFKTKIFMIRTIIALHSRSFNYFSITIKKYFHQVRINPKIKTGLRLDSGKAKIDYDIFKGFFVYKPHVNKKEISRL